MILSRLETEQEGQEVLTHPKDSTADSSRGFLTTACVLLKALECPVLGKSLYYSIKIGEQECSEADNYLCQGTWRGGSILRLAGQGRLGGCSGVR